MPNTLAHIGVQLSAGKLIKKGWDPRWLSLGLLIPDLPWIFQRFALAFLPFVSPMDVRAYLVVMTTPIFCGLLCLTIALLFRKSLSIFFVLFSQSIIHLILDASQEKGGVGIPFFGPIQWKTYEFPIFPMDGWISNLLTVSGVIVMLLIILKKIDYPRFSEFDKDSRLKKLTSILFLACYALAPFFLMTQVIDANVHELKTWNQKSERIGKTVHFDRSVFTPEPQAMIKDQFNPNGTRIQGIDHNQQALISVTATFIEEDVLYADAYIIHPSGVRFSYTVFGLFGIVLIWVYPWIIGRIKH